MSLRHGIVAVEIRPEHAHEERRRLARQGLADALGEHRIDLHQLIRKVVKHVANAGFDVLGCRALRRIDLHFKFAFVGGVRILAVLGAADLFGNTLDAGDGRQPCGDAPADARSLSKCNAGPQRCVRNQIVLTKIRQQPRAQERQ